MEKLSNKLVALVDVLNKHVGFMSSRGTAPLQEAMKQIYEVKEKPFKSSLKICPESCCYRKGWRGRGRAGERLPHALTRGGGRSSAFPMHSHGGEGRSSAFLMHSHGGEGGVAPSPCTHMVEKGGVAPSPCTHTGGRAE